MMHVGRNNVLFLRRVVIKSRGNELHDGVLQPCFDFFFSITSDLRTDPVSGRHIKHVNPGRRLRMNPVPL